MAAELTFTELLGSYAKGEGLDRLVRYAELLERWSQRHSLVSFKGRRELVDRHLVDALAGSAELGPSGRLLDVGSGAGLPGVPLLAVHPQWRGVLLEPRQKRWTFLRLVIRQLGLDADAVRCRFEDLDPGREGFDVMTTRALGGYDGLLRWAAGRLEPEGRVLIWCTSDEEERLAMVPDWRVLSSPLPGLDRGRLVRLQPCFT